MTNWPNQRVVYYQDDQAAQEAARAGHRQACAIEAQNQILSEQNEIMKQQAEIAAASLKLEQERIRASDLGITHAEYKRRLSDHAHALEELRAVEERYAELANAVKSQRASAGWHALWKKAGLYWRNRTNLIRHPFKSQGLLRPHLNRIERDVMLTHPGLRQANQQLQSHASLVSAARQKVVSLAAKL
jgi:hypothetical protein